MMQKDKNTPQVIRLAETTSTNNYLHDLCNREKLPEGSLVIADFQTKGKGQVGNTWESEPGKNLMFSILIYPDFIPANRQFLISQIAALSVKETLETYLDSVTVKWPNDIYWKDKKICGMLIENDLSGQHLYASVIGIGINLNQQVFRSDAPNPVSVVQITGKEVERDEVLQHFYRLFFRYYHLLLQEKYDEIRAAYMDALYRRNGYWPYKDEQGFFEACIEGIELTGHLVLRLSDGQLRRYAFKEVAYID